MQTKLVKTALLISVGAGLLSSCDSNNQTPPVERYEYKNDGSVVVDKVSKLEWMRCSLGEIWNNSASVCEGAGVKTKFDYLDNIEDVINRGQSQINVSGATDWRLPNIQELRSLRYCSELSEAEIGYLSEQENVSIKKAVRRYVDIKLGNLEEHKENIVELELNRETSIKKLSLEIDLYNAELKRLDEQLVSDLANLQPETQQSKDIAASKVIELELSLQSLQGDFEVNKSVLENEIVQNESNKQDEKEKHKGIISGVKSKFSDKLKIVRALREDLEGVIASTTSSEVIDLKEEKKELRGLVSFFTTVYAKDAAEIAVISEEVKRLSEVTSRLDIINAQEIIDLKNLDREIANNTNPEVDALFESEAALTSIQRRYFISESSIKSKFNTLIGKFEKENAALLESLEFSKLNREDQLVTATNSAKEIVQIELNNSESTLAEATVDTKRLVKIERHLIRQLDNSISTLVEALSINSIDELDAYLVKTNITELDNVYEIGNDILNNFQLYVTKDAELGGTYTGTNDTVREPCGYLMRSPINRYAKSEYKSNFTSGVWMLDEVAFPPRQIKRGSKIVGVNGDFFWSGSELSYNELRGWVVNFRDGRSSSTEKAFNGLIRLVRDAD